MTARASTLSSLLMVALASVYASTAPSAPSTSSARVLFYVPFNGSLDASVSSGEGHPMKAPRHPTFVEGRDGKGLLTGAPGSEVAYATAGNIDLLSGAVLMWVKPVNWSRDSYTRFFFRLAGNPRSPDRGDLLWLYKFSQSSVYALAAQFRPNRSYFIVHPATAEYGGKFDFEWRPGGWTQLIMSWSGDQLSLYINGRYAGSTHVPSRRLLEYPARVFVVGGRNRRGGGTADTVIDDLTIFDAPVTPRLAKGLYERGRVALQGKQPAGVALPELAAGYHIHGDKISITPTVLGVRPETLGTLRFHYTIRPVSGTGLPQQSGETVLTRFGQAIETSAANLATGDYRVTLAVSRGGESLATAETTFTKFARPVWLGNRLGTLSHVPAPWTPMEFAAREASVWGRSYSWSDGGLLSQVTSQGKPLLARPVTLRAVIDGEPQVMRHTHFVWSGTGALERPFALTADLGPLHVHAEGWIAYDGFLWYRISIDPPADAKATNIESLTLEISQLPKAATLMNGHEPLSKDGDGGAVRPVEGRIADGPVYWMGNAAEGLQWSTADLRDWRVDEPEHMLSLQPSRGAVTWTAHLIDHRIEIPKPLHYTLGLQATPVKPLPVGWRRWELKLAQAKTESADDGMAWRFWWSHWNQLSGDRDGPYGYMVPSKHTLPLLREILHHNLRPWIYWNQSCIWQGDPVLKLFGADWGGTYRPDALPHTCIRPPDTPDVNDFKIWRIYKLLDDHPTLRNGSAGIYSDVTPPRWVDNFSYPDGRVGSRYTILGRRALQRRVYQMIHHDWPGMLLSNHESGRPYMFQLAFADMYVTGEHLASDLANRTNYYDLLTYDRLRAAYNAHALGIPVIFLPELVRANRGNKKLIEEIEGPRGIAASEHLAGMLWVHDIIAWPRYINERPFLRVAATKAAFGYNGLHFHGYWEDSALVRQQTSARQVRTSLYTRPDAALFVVMNDSDKPAEVALHPDWNKLGVQPKFLVDLYSAQDGGPARHISVRDGEIVFTVKPRNFRALATAAQ